jgi:hypothetical protein
MCLQEASPHIAGKTPTCTASRPCWPPITCGAIIHIFPRFPHVFAHTSIISNIRAPTSQTLLTALGSHVTGHEASGLLRACEHSRHVSYSKVGQVCSADAFLYVHMQCFLTRHLLLANVYTRSRTFDCMRVVTNRNRLAAHSPSNLIWEHFKVQIQKTKHNQLMQRVTSTSFFLNPCFYFSHAM